MENRASGIAQEQAAQQGERQLQLRGRKSLNDLPGKEKNKSTTTTTKTEQNVKTETSRRQFAADQTADSKQDNAFTGDINARASQELHQRWRLSGRSLGARRASHLQEAGDDATAVIQLDNCGRGV